jgi:CspA family cold shock protein
MSTATDVTSTPVSTERFTGRVKWFNNKAGYGFITAADGSNVGADIFVHHSSIRVDAEQYKYLVLGEYVEFGLSSVSSSAHEIQASDVSGIKGGKLMCETRHEMLASRFNYKTQDKSPSQAAVHDETQDKDWKPVRKPRQQAPASDNKGQATTSSSRSPAAGRGGRGGRGRGPSTAGRGRGSTTAGRGRGSTA